MKFKILSVKGNSVRVNTGIVTFDVEVIESGGRKKLKVPENIYIAEQRDFNSLVGAVLYAIETNNVYVGDNNDDRQKAESREGR